MKEVDELLNADVTLISKEIQSANNE